MTVAAVRSKTSSSQATNGALAGAIVVVGLYVFGLVSDNTVPAEVGAALTVIVSYACARWLT